MASNIATSVDAKHALIPLGHAQLQALSKASGVPFQTLWNIRTGKTKNPGIDTVAKFLRHVSQPSGPADQIPTPS